MASSISDILSVIQSGVIALNNLAAQIKGSFNNILSRFVTDETNIATNTTAIALINAAWINFTPTLTASAGVYTTAAAAGRYKAIGKTILVFVEVDITTVGTGTYPLITLPVAPLNINDVLFYGSESALTGKALNARVSTATQLVVTYYDNTVPAANGATMRMSGVYEAA